VTTVSAVLTLRTVGSWTLALLLQQATIDPLARHSVVEGML